MKYFGKSIIVNKYKHPNHKYKFLRKFGEGSASNIYVSLNKDTNKETITKRISKDDEWKMELKILKLIKENPTKRLLELEDHYETEKFLYIITKKYEGYDLFDHIDVNIPYDDTNARKLIREMCKCIRDCHKLGVAHLDIKCENFMVLDPHIPRLVLIDFGHSEQVSNGLKKGCSKYGTSYYLCPEGYDHYYSKKSDIWSLGICAHLILTGDYPFNGCSRKYDKAVCNDELRISPKICQSARDFIGKSLCGNPENRPNIHQLLEHNYISSNTP